MKHLKDVLVWAVIAVALYLLLSSASAQGEGMEAAGRVALASVVALLVSRGRRKISQ